MDHWCDFFIKTQVRTREKLPRQYTRFMNWWKLRLLSFQALFLVLTSETAELTLIDVLVLGYESLLHLLIGISKVLDFIKRVAPCSISVHGVRWLKLLLSVEAFELQDFNHEISRNRTDHHVITVHYREAVMVVVHN